MALKLTPEQLIELRKQVQKEQRAKSKENPNLTFNLFIIREVYNILARRAGFEHATSQFYDYLGCTDKEYDNMIVGAYCYPEVKRKLESLGISDNHLRSDSAAAIPVSDTLKNLYGSYQLLKEDKKRERRIRAGKGDVFDEDEVTDLPTMSLKEFRENLVFLFTFTDKYNNLLLLLCNKIVHDIYNEMTPPKDRLADFWTMLAEMEYDGSDIKTKDLYKEIVEMTESYISDDSE